MLGLCIALTQHYVVRPRGTGVFYNTSKGVRDISLADTQCLLIPARPFYLSLCTHEHVFASNLLKILYVSFIIRVMHKLRQRGSSIFQTSMQEVFLANKALLLPYT